MIRGFQQKPKFFFDSNINGQVVKSNQRDYEKEDKYHREMLNFGFSYNTTHDFYYSKDGTLMSDSPISIESLLSYPTFLGLDKEGYEIGYGSPTPLGMKEGYNRAIYCKNYEDILERHRNTEQGRQESESEQRAIEDFYNGVIESSRKFRR